MARTGLVLVAAGAGQRLGGEPKQYRMLAGRAVLAHAMQAFLDHEAIDLIQPVIGAGQQAAFEKACPDHAKILPAALGGAARQVSVLAGLTALQSHDLDYVLIHDAARPWVPRAMIDRLIAALQKGAEGVTPALSVADSLRQVREGALGDSLERDGVFAVQTPQGGPFQLVLAAHEAASRRGESFTDDAALLRASGAQVSVVPGAREAMKLTTEEDLAMMEKLLSQRVTERETRVGQGFDVHSFGPGDHVVLCGLKIAHTRGLVGHSDADVLLHAITDALLGAMGAGDIGTHFPPSDPAWRGAPSSIFLQKALDLLAAKDGRLVHLDATLIGERPKLKDHRGAMMARLAELTNLAPHRLSLKATTTEKLGFTGREEGLAAMASATITLPWQE